MKYYLLTCISLFFLGVQTNAAKRLRIQTAEVSYKENGTELKGFCAWPSNNKKTYPVVLVLPEWWGCGDYVRMRAKQLADLGYFAMAVDIYGNGQLAQTPDEAGKLAGPFYQDPALANNRIQAAMDFVKTQSAANAKNISAIGYCFGGGLLLNAARMGMDLKKIVSFHGSLKGVEAGRSAVKTKILVCHGEADKFISSEDIAWFHQNMKQTGANYTFLSYPDATHAFTNPKATETGKKFNLPIAYNAKAEKKSWKDMLLFLKN